MPDAEFQLSTAKYLANRTKRHWLSKSESLTILFVAEFWIFHNIHLGTKKATVAIRKIRNAHKVPRAYIEQENVHDVPAAI